MIPTILLLTSLHTGSVSIMSFNDPVSCYNYVQRNKDQDQYTLECVPAGSSVTNLVTQNFHDVARIFNLVRGATRKATDE